MNRLALLTRCIGLRWVVATFITAVAFGGEEPAASTTVAVKDDSAVASGDDLFTETPLTRVIDRVLRKEDPVDREDFSKILDLLRKTREEDTAAPAVSSKPSSSAWHQRYRQKYAEQQTAFENVWGEWQDKWKEGSAEAGAEIAQAATYLAAARAKMLFVAGISETALLYQRAAFLSAHYAGGAIESADPHPRKSTRAWRYWREHGIRRVQRNLLYYERQCDSRAPYLDLLAAAVAPSEEVTLPLDAIPNPNAHAGLLLVTPDLSGVTEGSETPENAMLREETAGAVTPEERSEPEAFARALQEKCAQENGLPARLPSSVTMEFVLIPPVETEQNTPDGQISEPYYLATHEVTVGQFRQFFEATTEKPEIGETVAERQELPRDGSAPGFSQGDDHPVVCITWEEATAFCDWLSITEGKRYRLPTEREWEHACRAAAVTTYHFGDTCDETQANCDTRTVDDSASLVSYVGQTTPVGKYAPNAWGLYDMHGNVWEWCRDSATDSADSRIVRGGSWDYGVDSARASARLSNVSNRRLDNTGFRVLLEVDLPDSATTVPSPRETP